MLGLEEAARHLSGTPAERLGLHLGAAPRGVIREGSADRESVLASRNACPPGSAAWGATGLSTVRRRTATPRDPGKPMTVERREEIVAGLVAGFVKRQSQHDANP